MSATLPLLLALTGCFSSHNSAVTSEYARQVSTASVRVAQLEQPRGIGRVGGSRRRDTQTKHERQQHQPGPVRGRHQE